MKASKKELLATIAGLEERVAEGDKAQARLERLDKFADKTRIERDNLAIEVGHHRAEIAARAQAAAEKRRAELDAKKRIEREAHLRGLREGTLKLRNARKHTIVSEGTERGVSNVLHVEFELDGEELAAVRHAVERRKRPTNSIAFAPVGTAPNAFEQLRELFRRQTAVRF